MMGLRREHAPFADQFGKEHGTMDPGAPTTDD